MIRYKIDILDKLKDAGITQYKIRAENILGQRYIQQLRHGDLVSWSALDTVCKLLHCQPGDLIEYVEEETA